MITKEQIKEMRVKSGESLTECASGLGISYAKLWKLEAGTGRITKYDDLALKQYFLHKNENK